MAVFDPNVFYEKAQGQSEKFFFLFGDEQYLLKQAQKFIFDTFTVDQNDVFNFESFDLSETTWERVSESISQLPMMADFRTILIKNAELVTEKDLEQIEKDLTPKDPVPLVILISSDIDKKKKIYKLLTQKCVSCEFKTPYENQVPQWINYIADQKGLKIHNDALHTLMALVGTNLSEIDAEIEKISLYIAPAKVIEDEKVREVLGKTRQDSVFTFIEELYSKKHVDSLVMLADLLKNGQSEVGLMSLLARHLRILLQIQKGQSEGLRGQPLAQKAGVAPFFLNKYLQQANFWSGKDLENLLLVLAETETQLKSSSISNHVVLENMLLRFYRVSEKDTYHARSK